MMLHRFAALAAVSALMAGCASLPQTPAAEQPPQPPPRDLIAELYAMVEATDQIVVEPLPDPEVEDLKLEATSAIALRDLERAARHLMQALEIRPGRPDLLQLRQKLSPADRQTHCAHRPRPAAVRPVMRWCQRWSSGRCPSSARCPGSRFRRL